MNLTDEQLEYLHILVNKDRKEMSIESKSFFTAATILGAIVKDIRSNSCGWCHGNKYVTASNGFYTRCKHC